jgi:hypothetical protein
MAAALEGGTGALQHVAGGHRRRGGGEDGMTGGMTDVEVAEGTRQDGDEARRIAATGTAAASAVETGAAEDVTAAAAVTAAATGGTAVRPVGAVTAPMTGHGHARGQLGRGAIRSTRSTTGSTSAETGPAVAAGVPALVGAGAGAASGARAGAAAERAASSRVKLQVGRRRPRLMRRPLMRRREMTGRAPLTLSRKTRAYESNVSRENARERARADITHFRFRL